MVLISTLCGVCPGDVGGLWHVIDAFPPRVDPVPASPARPDVCLENVGVRSSEPDAPWQGSPGTANSRRTSRGAQRALLLATLREAPLDGCASKTVAVEGCEKIKAHRPQLGQLAGQIRE